MLPGKKLPGPEEVGVPVARGAPGTGPKLLNGCTPPRPPAASPSPKLPLRATPAAAAPTEDVTRRPKKPPSSPQQPRAAQGPGSTARPAMDLPRQSSGDSKQPPTSPQPGPGTPERGSCRSGTTSPAHSAAGDLAKAPQKAKTAAGGFCPSEDTDCGAELPAEPAGPEDSKVVKPKSSQLGSAAGEPGSTMSPPPAKKLALSAKKVSPGLGVSAGAGCPRVGCVCSGRRGGSAREAGVGVGEPPVPGLAPAPLLGQGAGPGPCCR